MTTVTSSAPNKPIYVYIYFFEYKVDCELFFNKYYFRQCEQANKDL